MVDYVRLCEWVAILWKIQSFNSDTQKKRKMLMFFVMVSYTHFFG